MKIGGAHEVAVDAPAERCMAILLDVPAYTDWWPGVTEAAEEDPALAARLAERRARDAEGPPPPRWSTVEGRRSIRRW